MNTLQNEFAAAMARMGPFGPAPRLAAGVSGGADSTALALLAFDWAQQAGGSLIALIVDHGLRADSAAEAALTSASLAARGIDCRVISLAGLSGGAKLQARARAARHTALAQAARANGALFLLLGHHQADQAETVAMRAARGASGLEGMAAWTARHDVSLLRPLLGITPERLRTYLRELGMPWVEDPSNTDQKFERVRVRLAGTSATAADPAVRQATEHETAAFLAQYVVLRPEGFAVIRVDAAPPAALAALLRSLGGGDYAPDKTKVARLSAALRPATLGGVRIQAAGRLGPGWLLAREPAACAAPVPAAPGALWDNRFRLTTGMAGAMLGALAVDAPKFRHANDLPATVLRGLPCLRRNGEIALAQVTFRPPAPATSHPFQA